MGHRQESKRRGGGEYGCRLVMHFVFISIKALGRQVLNYVGKPLADCELAHAIKCKQS